MSTAPRIAMQSNRGPDNVRMRLDARSEIARAPGRGGAEGNARATGRRALTRRGPPECGHRRNVPQKHGHHLAYQPHYRLARPPDYSFL